MHDPGDNGTATRISASQSTRILMLLAVLLSWCSKTAWSQDASVKVPPSSQSADAQEILSSARASIVQIKGFLGTNTAEAFHGTGFAVTDTGLFVTNYHVIAETVHHPERYRLEFRTPDGTVGKVSVVAIDLRRDLALVQAEGHAPPPLRLATATPQRGARAYAIGFPLNVGLTITEGISNGKVENTFDPRIHYSGALNPGMSGGPALNDKGEVIGVNVSGYLFSQLVAFLVPIEHASVLSRSATTKTTTDLQKDAVSQMKQHSDALMSAFAGSMATQPSAGYILPSKLAPFMECNASGNVTPDTPVEVTRINCSANVGLLVQSGLTSGSIKFLHVIHTTKKLDQWRFARQLSNLTHASGVLSLRKFVGPFSCKEQIIALNGFDAGVAVCVRAHRLLHGLFDITARIISLNAPDKAFASHLDMQGVDFDDGMNFFTRYIDAMAWRP